MSEIVAHIVAKKGNIAIGSLLKLPKAPSAAAVVSEAKVARGKPRDSN